MDARSSSATTEWLWLVLLESKQQSIATLVQILLAAQAQDQAAVIAFEQKSSSQPVTV